MKLVHYMHLYRINLKGKIYQKKEIQELRESDEVLSIPSKTDLNHGKIRSYEEDNDCITLELDPIQYVFDLEKFLIFWNDEFNTGVYSIDPDGVYYPEDSFMVYNRNIGPRNWSIINQMYNTCDFNNLNRPKDIHKVVDCYKRYFKDDIM